MLYSTSRGTSLDRQMVTWVDRVAALQKLVRYLREKVSDTGSDSSILTVCSAFSSAGVWLRSVTEPLPMSPLQANLTPSLLASMLTAERNG